MRVWTDERLQFARAECARWAGTRHRNRIALPGEGIDCVRFVLEVLVAAGICDRPRLPRYDDRLGIGGSRNIIEGILLTYLHAERATGEPEQGDILVTTVGRQSNHVGIVLDGQVWHVPGQGAVGPEPAAAWATRTQALVRLIALGYKTAPAITPDILRKL